MAKAGGYFYPRPPRGGRLPDFWGFGKADVFLSTPSARRATVQRQYVHQELRNFYPRPPRGGRLPKSAIKRYRFRFLSTPSARRATFQFFQRIRFGAKFLSTPSARRATAVAVSRKLLTEHFYPRPPRGGRRRLRKRKDWSTHFYPRPPRGGRQQKQRQNLYFLINYTTFCTNLEEP